MTRRIFVTNDRGYDLGDALRHTDLPPQDAFVRITSGKPNIFDTDELLSSIMKRTRDFTEADCILVCGSTLVSALVLALLARRFSLLSILFFDSRSRVYVEKQVRLARGDERDAKTNSGSARPGSLS